jgi:malonyl-CoA O-methyltransferase
MTPHLQFRHHAESYERYNLIQTRVARALAGKVAGPFQRIVDLGCGGGAFFRAYERPFTSYLAVDIAPEMLARHPGGDKVERMVGDFDDPALFEALAKREFDLLVSSSALQWAKDLDWTLARIASLGRPVALAIFTDGTFRSLREVTGSTSPIRSREATEELLRRHFDVEIDILKYELYFDDTLAMLRYIKRSGVSGGRRLLDYAGTKKLLADYPLPYLEFEVVRAVSTPLLIDNKS